MSVNHDTLVREFVEAFNTKDADRLAPYLDPDVVFHAYGEGEVRGATPCSKGGGTSSAHTTGSSSRRSTRPSTAISSSPSRFTVWLCPAVRWPP